MRCRMAKTSEMIERMEDACDSGEGICARRKKARAMQKGIRGWGEREINCFFSRRRRRDFKVMSGEVEGCESIGDFLFHERELLIREKVTPLQLCIEFFMQL